MAKLTCLQAVNEVLKRIGEPTIAALTSLTTIQLQAFDNLNRALEEIAQDGDLRPLEAIGTVTLLTGTSTYTPPNDYRALAIESFKQSDSNRNVNIITADEFDIMFPKGVPSDRTGYPSVMAEIAGVFTFDRKPTANENSKTVDYRYFKIPTLYATATATGTSYIPEGYDRTLLCDYATWLTMRYMGHPEAMDYYYSIFGDPSNKKPEGSLAKFKSQFRQPFLKARVGYTF